MSDLSKVCSLDEGLAEARLAERERPNEVDAPKNQAQHIEQRWELEFLGLAITDWYGCREQVIYALISGLQLRI